MSPGRSLAGSDVMKLREFEYRDPGQVVRDVMDTHPLEAGDVLLVLVRRPSTDQQVVAVRSIAPERRHGLDRFERSQVLAEEVQALPIPDWRPGPPEHSVMTIVARHGWCVIGAGEAEWLNAWFFSNHLCHTFSTELILVTEHGWTDFTTGLGGDEPRLRSLATVQE
jgi:hypothetical protein